MQSPLARIVTPGTGTGTRLGTGTGTGSISRCVHHFGSRTINGAGIDAEKLLSENRGKFAKKRGTAIGNGRQVPLKPWNGTPRISANQNQPRMNTDLHGWESGTKTAPAETTGSPSAKGFGNSLADPCFISVPSVAKKSSTLKATT